MQHVFQRCCHPLICCPPPIGSTGLCSAPSREPPRTGKDMRTTNRPLDRLSMPKIAEMNKEIMALFAFAAVLWLIAPSLEAVLPKRFGSSNGGGQLGPLKFQQDGTFQISIFEDLHFGESKRLACQMLITVNISFCRPFFLVGPGRKWADHRRRLGLLGPSARYKLCQGDGSGTGS
jgi:hypothetical protein